MSNELQLFSNEEFGEVRVVEIEGEPWFVAKDICDVLGLSNTSSAISLLDDDERSKFNLGRQGDTNIVNESGLHALILNSRKPEARKIRKWITSEVLPTIRKHGGYLTPQKIEEVLLNPDTLIRLATDLKEERARRIEAERTKAWIGSKREATAMATASSAVRKVTYLEDRLGEGKNWKQCKAVPWVLDYFAPSKGMWSVLGKKMAALSVDMGYEVRKIEDEKYGNLNAYHVDVWEEMHDRMEADRNMMSKYRKELAS